MKREEMIWIIDPETGTIEVETKGFTGKACQGVTAPILKDLGDDFEEKLTSEYYAKPLDQKVKVGQ